MTSDPDFMVAGLKVWIHSRQFEDSSDYWDGNWLLATATCSTTGSRVESSGPILHLGEVSTFLDGCRALYEKLEGEAILSPSEPNIRALLRASDSVGGISATIEITPDHLAESHSFKSQIDQSHLPYIIQGLESVLTRFPIRGTPS